MISATERVLAYLITNIPNGRRDELSVARVTKLLYLVDWKACIDDLGQLTDIEWELSECGPAPNPVLSLIDDSRFFERDLIQNHPFRYVVRLREPVHSEFSTERKNVLDYVLKTTTELSWDELRKLVYSTEPMLARPYGPLDLTKVAQEYREAVG